MADFSWQGTGWKNPKPAPGALALVQDFVNTRYYLHGGELLGNAEEATRRLTERGLLREGEGVGEEERRRLVAFREGLRGLLLAHNGVIGSGDAGSLDGPVASVAFRVRFDPEGHPALEPEVEGGIVERIVGRLLAEAVRAEAEGSWGRLKACRNEDCRWAFYDASKNRSGAWCSMQVCGARHKMRAYRERKAESEE